MTFSVFSESMAAIGTSEIGVGVGVDVGGKASVETAGGKAGGGACCC